MIDRRHRRLAILSCLWLFAACAVNPVTGRRELVLVSEQQEIAMGQQYAPQIASSVGLYDDPELQAYVEALGLGMARDSERPNLPWQFRVVDDSGVNAFAVPGGFIYVTRGILAHMKSEAELASVVGHEIGHVTARHSVNQMSKQQLAQIGMVAGMILLPEDMRQLGQVAGPAMQLFFLRYGRNHERQSDDLGFRYMTRAGYDPNEMVSMFQTLARTSRAAGGARVPEWMSTHPAPENRELRIRQTIAASGLDYSELAVGSSDFLRRLDGMVYGADPKQGWFAGARFHHPGLAFRLDFPSGWSTANQTTAVVALSPEKDAMMQLGLAQQASADEAARAFQSQQQQSQQQQGQQQQGLQSSRPERLDVSGLPALGMAFTAETQQGAIEGRVVFVEHAERVFQLLGYGPQERFAAHRETLRAALTSFAPETDPAVLAAKPWRLRIVTPERSLSVEEFARSYPGPVGAEELALINGIDRGERYAAGVSAKQVIGQPLPGTETARR